jgi:hypothetical protein
VFIWDRIYLWLEGLLYTFRPRLAHCCHSWSSLGHSPKGNKRMFLTLAMWHANEESVELRCWSSYMCSHMFLEVASYLKNSIVIVYSLFHFIIPNIIVVGQRWNMGNPLFSLRQEDMQETQIDSSMLEMRYFILPNSWNMVVFVTSIT